MKDDYLFGPKHQRGLADYESNCAHGCDSEYVTVEDATPEQITPVLLNELLQRALDHGVVIDLRRYQSGHEVRIRFPKD